MDTEGFYLGEIQSIQAKSGNIFKSRAGLSLFFMLVYRKYILKLKYLKLFYRNLLLVIKLNIKNINPPKRKRAQ